VTSTKSTTRALAKLFGTFHNVSYYASEMKAFGDSGLPEYWRAYMAYRSAPMGQVPASVIQSTFYNFAPAVVEAAVPSAWETTTPAAALALRDECVSQALRRGLPQVEPDVVDQISALALPAILQVDAGARPLFAAHRELPLPDGPLLRLWHCATLWREYRGDGHNLALASANVDGIECHVLLAGKGIGDRQIIEKIRGWNQDEWERAHLRLVDRGLLEPNGDMSEHGRELRNDIELHTDQLAAPAVDALGTSAGQHVQELLGPLVAELIENGLVAGRWPPRDTPRS